MIAHAPAAEVDYLREILVREDSYSRMPTLLALYPLCRACGTAAKDAWFTVLGDEWTSCDNVGSYLPELTTVLRANQRRWKLLMDEREAAAHRELPPAVTLYRGCGAQNRLGLCWTTERQIAARFPFTNRYRQAEPLLLEARVPKERIVAVKLDRKESEAITLVEARDIVSTVKLREEATP